jgi:hypothetical protein
MDRFIAADGSSFIGVQGSMIIPQRRGRFYLSAMIAMANGRQADNAPMASSKRCRFEAPAMTPVTRFAESPAARRFETNRCSLSALKLRRALVRREYGEQLGEAGFVGVAQGRLSVGVDPVRMLRSQGFANLRAKFGVGLDLIAHTEIHDSNLEFWSQTVGTRYFDSTGCSSS